MGDAPASANTTLPLLREGQRVFGRFILGRVLGRGGMGVVWKAHDEILEKAVALKFVIEAQAQDADAVASLKRETRRCQELRHPGIVAIFDLHQDDWHVAISMEYVEGATLSALKNGRENGCFDPADVLPWLEQLEAALTYAHEEARVVHRDLKPSNLILTPSGRLKVMDFGISQQLAGTVTGTSATWSGAVSPPYGSPQQLMGERPRVADDVYSLGATIYDLLSGRPPFFRGRIDLQVLESVAPSIEERRHELEHCGASIPRRWEEVVAQCLSKSADQRPASVAEVVRLLGEGLTEGLATVPVIRIERPKAEPIAVPVPAPAPMPTQSTRPKPLPLPDETATRVPPPRRAHWVRRIHQPEGKYDWIGATLLVLLLSAAAAGAIHFARHIGKGPVSAPPSIQAATQAAPAGLPIGSRPNPLDAPPRRSAKPPKPPR